MHSMNRPGSVICVAVLSSTSRLKARMPPNALVGSPSYAFTNASTRFAASAAPQGLPCLMTTAAGVWNSRTRPRAASRIEQVVVRQLLAVQDLGRRQRAHGGGDRPRRRTRPSGAGSRRSGGANASSTTASAAPASRRVRRFARSSRRSRHRRPPLPPRRPRRPDVRARPERQRALRGRELRGHRLVLRRADEDGDILVVFARGPDHGGAADVDVLDDLLMRGCPAEPGSPRTGTGCRRPDRSCRCDARPACLRASGRRGGPGCRHGCAGAES